MRSDPSGRPRENPGPGPGRAGSDCGLDVQGGARVLRERSRELAPGADAELREHLAQMPFDRPWAEEESRADLRIGHAVAGEPGDLLLLRGELVACLGAALADLLAGREELAACAFGEGLHADDGEHLVGRAELFAGVDPAALAAKPLAVEEVGTRGLRAERRAAQAIDGLAVEILGDGAVAQQRSGARLDSERPLGAAGSSRLRKALEPDRREPSIAAPGGRLDEFGRRPRRRADLVRALAGLADCRH